MTSWQFFFQFLLSNYALEPPNHKTLCDFTLPCLWNVQIQLQFWCWLFLLGRLGWFNIWICTFHRYTRIKWKLFLWLGGLNVSLVRRNWKFFLARHLGRILTSPHLEVEWEIYNTQNPLTNYLIIINLLKGQPLHCYSIGMK